MNADFATPVGLNQLARNAAHIVRARASAQQRSGEGVFLCLCGHRDAFAAVHSSIVAMRELKHHEKKLLRKHDFLQWKKEKNIREIKVLRRYMIQDREDYVR